MLLGGLTGSTSAGGVFTLDTGNGSLRWVGSLPVGTHDAVGPVVAGRYVVFGGGSSSTPRPADALIASHSAQAMVSTSRAGRDHPGTLKR